MELIVAHFPKSTKQLVIAPLGDFQWSGHNGPTAKDHLKRHIDRCLERNAYFIGMGDYIDFASPSNRQKIQSAGLYDTAYEVIKNKAIELTDEVFNEFLKDTVGRWLGLVEGHHFFEYGDETTDTLLAGKLKCPALGTSAYIRLAGPEVVLWVHHGIGGGKLPGTGLNTLYHVAAGLAGADAYLMGHNTKLTGAKLSRPFPVWIPKPHLRHSDILLVNTGGFSRSNIPGHRHGIIPRGDYAEKAMMTPSPLSAPLLEIDGTREAGDRVRVLL